MSQGRTPTSVQLSLADRFAAVSKQSMSVPAALRARAATRPERKFLHIGDVEYTYAETDERVSRLATGLAAAGVGPGDRVAFMCETRIEFVELIFATWRLGAVAVPLNVYLRGKTLEHQLRDSGSSFLVVDQAGLEIARPVAPELPELRRIVLLDDSATDVDPLSGVEFVEHAALYAAEIVQFPDRDKREPAMIMYTSGTTGLPKGCVLSQRYCYHVGRMMVAVFDLDDEDVVFSVGPLYHFGGIIPLMAALVQGIPFVGEPRYSATAFLKRATEVGATMCQSAVGWIASTLLAQPPSEYDRAHKLRKMMLVPVSEKDRLAFEERFGIRLVTEAYGQTEATLVAVTPPEMDPTPGSAGRIAPWMEVTVVDDDDAIVPSGEVGEIVVRPRFPGVTYDGYWRRDDATVEATTTFWHHTGDLGTLDEEGVLRFVDRKSDSMRRRGENISSFEIEQVIIGHAMVAEVAVHPVALDNVDDDAVKACIVPAPGTAPTPAELAEFLRRELPYFACPRFVELLDELPRNASGRVMKYQLRERPLGDSVWDLESMGLLVGRDKRRVVDPTK